MYRKEVQNIHNVHDANCTSYEQTRHYLYHWWTFGVYLRSLISLLYLDNHVMYFKICWSNGKKWEIWSFKIVAQLSWKKGGKRKSNQITYQSSTWCSKQSVEAPNPKGSQCMNASTVVVGVCLQLAVVDSWCCSSSSLWRCNSSYCVWGYAWRTWSQRWSSLRSSMMRWWSPGWED